VSKYSKRIIFALFILALTNVYSFAVGHWHIFPYMLMQSVYDQFEEVKYRFSGALNQENEIFDRDLWNYVQVNSNNLNHSIILNDFKMEWKRIDDENIKKIGSSKLVEDNILFVNQDSQYIFNKLGIDYTYDNHSANAGIKGVIERNGITIIYVAFIEKNCATAKLVILETNKDLLRLPCLQKESVDLDAVGGGILKLNDSEYLLSTGTPTTQIVNHEINQFAQDDNSFWGKILKLSFAENDFTVSIFSKGHRNPQGLVRINKQIFSVEHGPRGGDEINLLFEGGNYGWPLQSFGSEYDLNRINKNPQDIRNNVLPLYTFLPSIGISSINKCPKTYSLFYDPFKCLSVSSLRGNSIYFVIFEENRVLFTENLFFNSRIREFHIDDDDIYALTDSSGLIVGKMTPLVPFND